MIPRLTGDHHHKFGNVADVLTDDALTGYVLTVGIPTEAPIWAPPVGAAHEIISDTHTDTDPADTPADGDVLTYATADSKWHPAAPTGGGSSSGRFYIPFGSGEEVFSP